MPLMQFLLAWPLNSASQKVFEQIYKSTRQFAFFFEGFREYNNVFQQLHQWRMDYFRGSYYEARKAGFKGDKFQAAFHQQD
jgi:hypothetical protein